MKLLICPVRPGDRNEELRFALRSWETNLHLGEAGTNNLTLMTVGYRPTWLEPDYHVVGNFFNSAPMAVFDNIRLGCEKAVSHRWGEIIIMNDDFFCLDPVGAILPVRRNCTLAQHIAQFPVNAGTWWARSLRLTASWLADEGFPHPESYEVHRPLFCDAQAMLSALDRWGPADLSDTVPQWRTIYGTLNHVHAYPVGDVKLGPRTDAFGSPWVSTSDESWRRYGPKIVKGFQKPSRWEIS